MGDMKEHQPPMTIDEQVENLKSIGLVVEDEEYAKRILNDISYFRLVKAYSLNLKSRNGNYNVSAKYCYVTRKLRLHQNDRCKRFTLF